MWVLIFIVLIAAIISVSSEPGTRTSSGRRGGGWPHERGAATNNPAATIPRRPTATVADSCRLPAAPIRAQPPSATGITFINLSHGTIHNAS